MRSVQFAGIRVTVVTISVLVALAVAILLSLLVVTVISSTIPFDNDEANHAVDGWEVYHALASLSPSALYRSVTDQGFYPPVHSFFVAAAYLVAGPSFASSRLPTVVIFALNLLLLAWLTLLLGRKVGQGETSDGWLPLAGTTFAVAFAITSEIFVLNTVLVMLEMTGALFGLLLLLIIDQVDGLEQGRSRWVGLVCAAVIVVVLLLTKYTFGLFYLPGLFAALLTATWPWRADRLAWRDLAVVSVVIALLGGLWLLVTHRETMLLFFSDHPQRSTLLSAENLLYHLRRWFQGYSLNAGIGWISILLGLVGAWRRWRLLAVRTAVWSILAALVILAISPTDEPRHFVPVAPAVWLVAGLGLVETLRWLQRQANGPIAVVAVLVALLALIIVGAIQPATSLRVELIDEFEGTATLAQAQDFALQHVALDQPVLFIGDLNDQNGLLAIRWRAAVLANKSVWDLAVDYFPFENHEHSLYRTHRKPQIATVDPTFPRQYMNQVLARNEFAYVVEMKALANYFGPRAGNPEDPLCGYPTRQEQFADWIVIVYESKAAVQTDCHGG